MATLTVGQLSEAELLKVINAELSKAQGSVDSFDVLVGSGDDCAVLATSDGRYCVSTDVLVQGHHFRTSWSSAEQIGARAAAQNLADIAAMGARPSAVVVGLAMPATTPLPWLEGFTRGLGLTCAQAGAQVVGGDLSGGQNICVSVCVHGDLGGRDPVLRSGAKPGDVLVHAGKLGHSAAGLELLQRCPDFGTVRQREDMERIFWRMDGHTRISQELLSSAFECLTAFRAPQCPLEYGPLLAQCGAHAMMDVSDSLLRDATRIAKASAVAIDIDDPLETDAFTGDVAALRPLAKFLGDFSLVRKWILSGGEDHGLLATLAAADQPKLKGHPQARPIGRILPADGLEAGTVLVAGQPTNLPLGWDHFGN